MTSIAGASFALVVLTACVTFSCTLIKGVRWWLFLRRSTDLRLLHVLRLTIAGTGLNSVLFANAGDIMRVRLAARGSGAPVATILGTLASDKVVDVLAFATMAVAAMTAGPQAMLPRRAIPTVAVLGALVLLVFLFARLNFSARAFLMRFASEARACLRGSDAVLAYALSLISWPLQVLTYSIGAAAVGLHVPLAGTVEAVIAVNLAGVLRSTPGNVGVFQLMYALALAPFGIPGASAVAAAVLIQSVQLLSAAIAGALAGVTDFIRSSGRSVDISGA
jgi:uncharacterized membrane protein YbhN (UPF0104 family)